jgi:hypothetical protein
VDWLLGLEDDPAVPIAYDAKPRVVEDPHSGIIRTELKAHYTGDVPMLFAALKPLAKWHERREWNPTTSTLVVRATPVSTMQRLYGGFDVHAALALAEHDEGSLLTLSMRRFHIPADRMPVLPAIRRQFETYRDNGIDQFFGLMVKTLGGEVVALDSPSRLEAEAGSSSIRTVSATGSQLFARAAEMAADERVTTDTDAGSMRPRGVTDVGSLDL